MANKVQLGSVSHGTMRPEDLIPDFLYVLGQADKAAHDKIVADYADLVDSDEPDWDSEDADWCLDALFDALNEVAPPYCHFGAHEGDGADYGFWISWDSLQDDTDNEFGPVFKIDAGDEWEASELPEGVEYVLEVTDHGNATLYARNGSEVWSVV